MSNYPLARASEKPAGRDRYVFGGVDVTYDRGVPVTFPGYQLVEPFGYGPTSFTFPKRNLCLQQKPTWAKAGKQVLIQRVFDDGTRVTDYVGVVISARASGTSMIVEVGGEVTGRAELREKQPPVFRHLRDVGNWMYLAAGNIHVRMTPRLGPTTGIEIPGAGSVMSLLAWMQQVCSMAQKRNGDQYTFMPKNWGASPWEFRLKDRTTKDLTLYMDGERVAPDLADDASEQPNTWYGTGVNPDGGRWNNSKLPGFTQGPAPAYPNGTASFGVGTTDADTTSGDGVTVLQKKLTGTGYLQSDDYSPGVYNQKMADAVSDLQDDRGLSSTGTMDPATWKALFDVDTTGFTIDGAEIHPLVQKSAVRYWDYTSNGSIAGRNPSFDRSVLEVDRTTDFGTAIWKAQGRDWCRAQMARVSDKNWTGTIRLNNIGAISGVWDVATDGTTVPAARIMSHRDIRPGMNAWLPLFDGGTLVHIAGVDVDDSGATLTVDTQARDRMELAEIIARNRESRRNIRREWNVANMGGKQSKGMVTYDAEWGGMLSQDVACAGAAWTIIPIPMGQQGTVSRIHLQMKSAVEFCVAIFGSRVTTKLLDRRVGDPFPVDSSGQTVWETKSLQDWFDNRELLYAAGSDDQPCGYGRRRKYGDKVDANGNPVQTDAPLTGAFVDDATFPYITPAFDDPVVYLAIYPRGDSTLEAGRRLYKLEDDSV